MTAYCENAGARPHGSFARSVLGWIAGLTGLKKADPHAAASQDAVQVPRHELQRLTETSPHLLADIGVMPEAATGETSPWRLQDGRHLLLRPPL
ncbi:hypothetical protein K3552_10615 [Leisingera aquaemixtae]|uniref:hypothetical protein n=1 Tax=Leisingera aquaemixtae TaxID=1396826 RepID=UPI0021A8082A|nr:hypothetical protein [Leisingera aquaemixtae]UWQ35981.1 hypothetical protein K3552_10615 [Leisingera aquaemixtae]